jgi:hypothetical protein
MNYTATSRILSFISAAASPPAAKVSCARLRGHRAAFKAVLHTPTLITFGMQAHGLSLSCAFARCCVLPAQPSLWLLATSFLSQSLQSFRFEGEESILLVYYQRSKVIAIDLSYQKAKGLIPERIDLNL